MIVSANYSQTQFGALVPIKKYTGNLLHLTNEDKQQISKLQSSIAQLEAELYQLTKHFAHRKLSDSESSFFYNRCFEIQFNINSLLRSIKEIKVNRLNMQNLCQV